MCISGRFMYVFDTKARDLLLGQKYKLLKADIENNIFVFDNYSQSNHEFAFNNLKYIVSDTLTF